MNAISVACSHGNLLPRRSRRDDNCAVAVVEENVCAVGLGKARRALEEFFSIHDGDQAVEVRPWSFVAFSAVDRPRGICGEVMAAIEEQRYILRPPGQRIAINSYKSALLARYLSGIMEAKELLQCAPRLSESNRAYVIFNNDDRAVIVASYTPPVASLNARSIVPTGAFQDPHICSRKRSWNCRLTWRSPR